MSTREEHSPAHVAGEAGSGTVPGDQIGTGGVTGGTGAFGVSGGTPPRSRALGTANTASGDGATHVPAPPSERALAKEIHEHTVVPEARWGVDSGSPSGGTSGGTPAGQVRQIIRDDSGDE